MMTDGRITVPREPCIDCTHDYCRCTARAKVALAGRRSSFDLAAMLIQNEQEPPEWADAFRQVKFDTADNPDYKGEHRWVVIVAKGENADRIVEAYDHD